MKGVSLFLILSVCLVDVTMAQLGKSLSRAANAICDMVISQVGIGGMQCKCSAVFFGGLEVEVECSTDRQLCPLENDLYCGTPKVTGVFTPQGGFKSISACLQLVSLPSIEVCFSGEGAGFPLLEFKSCDIGLNLSGLGDSCDCTVCPNGRSFKFNCLGIEVEECLGLGMFSGILSGDGSELSDYPSDVPSDPPSDMPSDFPSNLPSDMPSDAPSESPTEA